MPPERYGKVETIAVASSLTAYGDQDTQPVRRVVPAERQRPVRGLQSVHGHHRALLRRHLRHAVVAARTANIFGPADPAPGPHHPRHAALAAARRAPGDPQRRLALEGVPARLGHRRGVRAARRSGRPGRTCAVGRSTSTPTSRSAVLDLVRLMIKVADRPDLEPLITRRVPQPRARLAGQRAGEARPRLAARRRAGGRPARHLQLAARARRRRSGARGHRVHG